MLGQISKTLNSIVDTKRGVMPSSDKLSNHVTENELQTRSARRENKSKLYLPDYSNIASQPGSRVRKLLKLQDELEEYVGTKLKAYLGRRRYNWLKHKVRSNRNFAIRMSDIALATMISPGLAPMTAIAAAAIKLEDPCATPFFHQDRVGKDNIEFEIYKLRTMFAAECKKEFSGVPAKDDPRILKIGKILRAAKIDEFPQVINVLKGEMSLVGPRPWLRKETETLPELLQKRRSQFKPGLTSLASIRGHNLSLIERAQLDVEFMENMSLLGYYLTILSTLKNTGLSLIGKADIGVHAK